MNFLAHLYLTKDHPEEVSIGNFMADAIKGQKKLLEYPEAIQLGIKIHRAIDDFTDSHELFKQGTKRLHENYGKYAPVIMDLFYDHILAVNWKEYSDMALNEFSLSRYKLIENHFQYLPMPTQNWFSYMKQYNLLLAYADESGIHTVLKRMDKRTGSISGMGTAINELRLYKKEYTNEFKTIFEDMQTHLKTSFAL